MYAVHLFAICMHVHSMHIYIYVDIDGITCVLSYKTLKLTSSAEIMLVFVASAPYKHGTYQKAFVEGSCVVMLVT